jgi:hypothetical protein
MQLDSLHALRRQPLQPSISIVSGCGQLRDAFSRRCVSNWQCQTMLSCTLTSSSRTLLVKPLKCPAAIAFRSWPQAFSQPPP